MHLLVINTKQILSQGCGANENRDDFSKAELYQYTRPRYTYTNC